MEKPATATVPTPGDADLTGKTVGDFRVLRRLGEGGMGQVYLAEQLSLKRNVALKIMRSDLAANANALERFRREAEAVARVTHANIVQVHACGAADGLNYMALEFVDGKNLAQYLEKKGPPEILLALSIMRQVAAALFCAAESGIVHRDIKPENILLTRKGEVKVADFGLSRCFGEQQASLTQSGISMGTPLYMSPEQVHGREVDPRTDIYSFGVTCYHMFAGQPPFRGQNPIEVALMHVQKQAVPLNEVRPDLPIELCQVVHKMMAKAPDDRYQTARELLKDLTRLREGLGGNAGKTEHIQLTKSQSTLASEKDEKRRPLSDRPLFRRALLYSAVGISLAFALAGGMGFRIWKERHRALDEEPGKEAAINEPTRPPPAPDPLEAALLEAFHKPYNAAKAEASRHHLDTAVQLGAFYLNQRRLKDADAYFQELRNRPTSPDQKLYQALGKIGQALVLAFQDRAKESNEMLLELEKHRPPGDRPRLPGPLMRQHPEFYLLNHPRLRPLVCEALDHNVVNIQPDALPKTLEQLRHAPAVAPRGKP